VLKRNGRFINRCDSKSIITVVASIFINHYSIIHCIIRTISSVNFSNYPSNKILVLTTNTLVLLIICLIWWFVKTKALLPLYLIFLSNLTGNLSPIESIAWPNDPQWWIANLKTMYILWIFIYHICKLYMNIIINQYLQKYNSIQTFFHIISLLSLGHLVTNFNHYHKYSILWMYVGITLYYIFNSHFFAKLYLILIIE